MTKDRDFKKVVRAQAARTGERYTEVRGALRPTIAGGASASANPFVDLEGWLTSVVRGKDHVVRMALIALVARGHVLFEDLAGTARSLLVRSMASGVGGSYASIRGSAETSASEIPTDRDLLEVDDLLLAGPSFRSALLDVMDGSGPLVFANVNPVFPAPAEGGDAAPIKPLATFGDAQRDRFLMKLSMGYPDPETELSIVNASDSDGNRTAPRTFVTPEQLDAARTKALSMRIPEDLSRRIVDVVSRSRSEQSLRVGASPRATRALARAAAASAVVSGRSSVTEEDLEQMWLAVLGHRLILTESAIRDGETVDAVVARIAS